MVLGHDADDDVDEGDEDETEIDDVPDALEVGVLADEEAECDYFDDHLDEEDGCYDVVGDEQDIVFLES